VPQLPHQWNTNLRSRCTSYHRISARYSFSQRPQFLQIYVSTQYEVEIILIILWEIKLHTPKIICTITCIGRWHVILSVSYVTVHMEACVRHLFAFTATTTYVRSADLQCMQQVLLLSWCTGWKFSNSSSDVQTLKLGIWYILQMLGNNHPVLENSVWQEWRSKLLMHSSFCLGCGSGE